MARKVGSVYVELLARLTKLEQGLNEGQRMAQRSAAKMQGIFDKINFDQAANSFSKFQRLMMGGFAGIGTFNIAKQFVDVASSFEIMQVKLEQLYGENRGKLLFEELNKIALELPVSTQAVIDGFVKMSAMGLEPTRKMFLTLADAASVLGEEAFGRIVLQMGQMSAKGKIMQQDLNVLADAGIAGAQILYDAFGKTVEQLQNSDISIQKIINALVEGIDKKFGGASERMMKTWAGLTETAKSYFIEVERQAAAAGVFEVMKNQLRDVTEWMKKWLEANQQFISQDLPGAVDKVTNAVKGLVNEVKYVYTEIGGEAIATGIIGRLLFGSWKPAALLATVDIADQKFRELAAQAGLQQQPGFWERSKETFSTLLYSMRDASNLAFNFFVKYPADFVRRIPEIRQGLWENIWGWSMKPVRIPIEFTSIKKDPIENLQRIGEDVDDWYIQRWKRQRIWGYKISQEWQDTLKPPDPEKIQKELDRIEKIEREALERHKKMIEEFSAIAPTQFPTMAYPEETRFVQKFTEIQEAAKAEQDKIWVMMAEDETRMLMEKVKKYESTYNSMTNLSERTAEAMQENFSDLFFDAMTGKLDSFEDYATATFTSIQRAFADMAGQMATQALFGPEFKGGGLLTSIMGMFGGNAANLPINQPGFAGAEIFHRGGVAGRGSVTRRIPASAFSFAPRYHEGLMPNEVPAILEKGETVIPKGEVGKNINVHNHYYSTTGRFDQESVSRAQAATLATLQRAMARNT